MITMHYAIKATDAEVTVPFGQFSNVVLVWRGPRRFDDKRSRHRRAGNNAGMVRTRRWPGEDGLTSAPSQPINKAVTSHWNSSRSRCASD